MRGDVARSTSSAALVPLGVLVIAFFLPAAKDCDQVRSPIEFTFDNVLFFTWIGVPYFVSALLLAVGAAAVMRVRAPRGKPLVASLGAVGLIGLSLAITGLVTIIMPGGDADIRVVGAGCLVVGSLTMALLVRARRRGAWTRWWFILGAHAIACAPLATANALIGREYGAWIFVGGYALLVVLQVAALVRRSGIERRDIAAPSP